MSDGPELQNYFVNLIQEFMDESPKEENYRNHLKKVSKELFRHNYLTLLGLGQAVVFHLLAEKVYDNFQHHCGLSLSEILQISTSLLILFLTWNEYYIGLSLFVWTARLVDTLIPFGLFITETIMVKSIDNPAVWFMGLCPFTLLCFLGLGNELKQAKRYEENDVGLQKSEKRIKRCRNYLLLGSMTSLVILLVGRLKVNSLYTTIVLAITFLMFILYAIDTVRFWDKIIQFIGVKSKESPGQGVDDNQRTV